MSLRGADVERAFQSDIDALREAVRGSRPSSSPMRAAASAEIDEPFMKAR